MPSSYIKKLQYATYLNYSPRGQGNNSETSRRVVGAVKNASQKTIRNALRLLSSEAKDLFQPFLNSEVMLVPVPGSSPKVEGAPWPSKLLADVLLDMGYAKSISTCLHRHTQIRKSSLHYTAASRPSVQEHLETFTVDSQLLNTDQITLVDDVLTLGRTTVASALKLLEAYPHKDIKIFCLVQTKGFEDEIENLIDPSIGELTYYSQSGKVWRE